MLPCVSCQMKPYNASALAYRTHGAYCLGQSDFTSYFTEHNAPRPSDDPCNKMKSISTTNVQCVGLCCILQQAQVFLSCVRTLGNASLVRDYAQIHTGESVSGKGGWAETSLNPMPPSTACFQALSECAKLPVLISPLLHKIVNHQNNGCCRQSALSTHSPRET